MSDWFFVADVQQPMLPIDYYSNYPDPSYNIAITESSIGDASYVTEQSSDEREPIIVTGARHSGGGFWFAFEEFGQDPRFDDDYITLEPGAVPTYYDFLQAECQADLTTDLVARQIEALIKAQPDWNAREYGAVIYMVDNEIRMGPLIRGETVAEALAAGREEPLTRIPIPTDIGDGVILAVVHSHPDLDYSALQDLENRYPSDRPDSGDYYSMEQFVGTDGRFGNNAAFAQYILGPDGVLREFNFSEGRVTLETDAATDAAAGNNAASDGRSNLAKDRPCAS